MKYYFKAILEECKNKNWLKTDITGEEIVWICVLHTTEGITAWASWGTVCVWTQIYIQDFGFRSNLGSSKTLGLCWGSNISQSLWWGQYLLLCGFISEGEQRHTTFPAQVATLQSWVRSENTASHSYTPPSLLQDSFFPISSLQGQQFTLNFAGFHGGKFYVAVPAPISFPLLAEYGELHRCFWVHPPYSSLAHHSSTLSGSTISSFLPRYKERFLPFCPFSGGEGIFFWLGHERRIRNPQLFPCFTPEPQHDPGIIICIHI